MTTKSAVPSPDQHQKDALDESTGVSAATVRATTLQVLPPANSENGVLFRVLHSVLTTCSITNGFGNERAWDADQDVVLAVAFLSSPTRQVWTEFGLKLKDVRDELNRTTAEQSKLLGRTRSVFRMFCNANDMPDFNEKVARVP